MILSMLSEAWMAMWANRLRTILTMLGMVIGVGAVILMLAVGQGAQQQVQASIASMGSNLFIILSGSSTSGGLRMGGGATPTLTVADAQSLEELPMLVAVAPSSPGTAQMVYGPNNWSTQVIGTTPSYLQVRDWQLASGSPFTDSDVRAATRVALLGQTVAHNLFGDVDPVDKTIRIKNSPYVVLGVLAAKGQSLDGRDQDDTVLVPVTTAQRKLFGTQFAGSVRFIMAQAISAEAMPAAEKAITELLRQRHRIREGAENDFSIRNLTATANTAAETAQVMSLMLGAIASISLLVGGIGIMNIMLVSVTERTREIGIRMAIGARSKDILLQFLLEAIIISVIGCLIGVLLGVGGALLVSKITGMAVVITISGSIIDRSLSYGIGGVNPLSRAHRESVFLSTVFVLMGKIAKADGRVSEQEIAHIEQMFQKLGMTAEHRQHSIALFKKGSTADFDIKPALQEFMSVCGHTASLRQMLLVYLIVMAFSDDRLDAAEEAMLKDIALHLGYSQEMFQQLMTMVINQTHFASGHTTSANSLGDAYKALGMSKENSDPEIKRAYRKLMSQYHPDKLMGQGMPEDMIAVATAQAQEVQIAYDLIKKSRNM